MSTLLWLSTVALKIEFPGISIPIKQVENHWQLLILPSGHYKSFKAIVLLEYTEAAIVQPTLVTVSVKSEFSGISISIRLSAWKEIFKIFFYAAIN